jgi:arylsulfatase A-like enzyme
MKPWIGRTGDGILALLFAVSAACHYGARSAERLNVLLVTLDTTRTDYVSPTGGDPRVTPQLQALGERSAVFTHAVSETNVTNPSHLTIMSGLRAIEHGVLSNVLPVPPSVDTLAEAMERAGYRTAGFPAARHLGPEMGWRGFDLLPGVEQAVDARWITDRTVSWLTQSSDRPFFLWAHYFDPHALYTPPPEIAALFYRVNPAAGDDPPIAARDYFSKRPGAAAVAQWLGETRDPEYPRAMYAAEIHYVDREIGRLLAELESAGLADNTLVVVVGDHGESLGEHGIFYDHFGLYEPQLLIPLLFHVPGLAPTRSGALVSTLDVAPTIAALTGVRFRHQLSGRSLLPLLRGEDTAVFSTTTTLVHQNAHNHSVAVRQGPWKLIWPINLEHSILSHEPELYQLEDDPGELTNLARAEPQRVREMRRLLQPWIELGRVERGDGFHLAPAALEQLRALGYLGD